MKTSEKIGRIYFIQQLKAVKIGFATSVEERMDALKTAMPYEPALLLEIPGNRADEKAFHKKFEHLRINREWFSLNKELLKFITQKQEELGQKARMRTTRENLGEFISAREFFIHRLGGSMMDAVRATGIAYSTLQSHVKRGVPIKNVDIAKKLEAWDPRISAAKTLGV